MSPPPQGGEELKRQGLIRHIDLSNVTAKQLSEARATTEVVCVQNFYNVVQRKNDAFIDDLATQGIAYVPFFPLGGFTPLQSSALGAAAASLKVTHAARAGLASPSLTQHPADSGNSFPRTSPREFESCVASDSPGSAGQSQLNW